MILIEGIKDRITSQPLIAGDAAITVEVVQHENLLNGMAKRSATLNLSQAVRKLLLESFDRFAEPFNAFTELVSGHSIFSHH